MACIRPNHPDVVDYADRMGVSTMVVAGIIGAWQEENSSSEFPSFAVTQEIWDSQEEDIPFIPEEENDEIEKGYPSWVSDNDLLVLEKAKQNGLIDLKCN
jgi:hypothetical protein